MISTLTGTKYENKDVIEGNPLVKAARYFDTIEGRLFYLAVMEVNPRLKNSKFYDENFREVTIPTDVLMKVLGGDSRLYKKLVPIARKLLKRTIEVELKDENGNEKWMGMTIFSTMDFSVKDGGLKVCFNEKMKPFLLDFTENPYTRISGQLIFSLRSGYSIRLLELLLQYKNFPPARKENTIVYEYSVDSLRKCFGIEDNKYAEYRDFKKGCIDLPIKEINSSTNYRIEYTAVKKGRKVSSLIFTLTLPSNIASIPEELPTVKQIVEKAEKKITAKSIAAAPPADMENKDNEVVIDRLKSKKIEKGISRNWLKKYGIEKLLWVENYTDNMAKNGNVQNYGAYFCKIIESDVYENIKAEETRIAAEKELSKQEYIKARETHIAQQKQEEAAELKNKEEYFLAMSIYELQSELKRLYEMRDSWLMTHNNGEITKSIFMKTHMRIIEQYEKRLRDLLYINSQIEYGAGPANEQEICPVDSISTDKRQKLENMIENLTGKMTIKY